MTYLDDPNFPHSLVLKELAMHVTDSNRLHLADAAYLILPEEEMAELVHDIVRQEEQPSLSRVHHAVHTLLVTRYWSGQIPPVPSWVNEVGNTSFISHIKDAREETDLNLDRVEFIRSAEPEGTGFEFTLRGTDNYKMWNLVRCKAEDIPKTMSVYQSKLYVLMPSNWIFVYDFPNRADYE